MRYFAVIREAGPAWTEGQGITGQPAVADHTAFMGALAEDGFLLFGGPLAGSEEGRLRALLIIGADSEDEIRHRLADDPWAIADRLVIAAIEPWKVFTGADRLPSTTVATGANTPPSS